MDKTWDRICTIAMVMCYGVYGAAPAVVVGVILAIITGNMGLPGMLSFVGLAIGTLIGIIIVRRHKKHE